METRDPEEIDMLSGELKPIPSPKGKTTNWVAKKR
jgi:hypothetical protein